MSYGRMAGVYPSTASAYTYVGRELHPALGYVTSWSMTMDYILNPLVSMGFPLCRKKLKTSGTTFFSLRFWYASLPDLLLRRKSTAFNC